MASWLETNSKTALLYWDLKSKIGLPDAWEGIPFLMFYLEKNVPW